MTRLFVAQIVIAIEDQWMGTGAKTVRTSMSYAIHAQMLAAEDEDGAFRKVQGWLDSEGFSDSNHDGKGDMTKMYAIGIHQIEEIVALKELPDALDGPYGVDLPVYACANVDPTSGAPVVREKCDLEIYRLLEFSRGPEHGFSIEYD